MSVRMSRAARLGVMLGLAAFTAACDLMGPVCTAEAVPAILVDVRAAETGERVSGNVRVVATDGAFVTEVDTETFHFGPEVDRDTVAFGPFGLAHERAGTYVVRVEAAGYRPWQREGITVRRGECHVRTEELTTALERIEAGVSR